jgi:translation elongation factor P/translation initiation factor 5A
MRANEIKKGNVVEYNGGVYQVRDIERSSPHRRGGNVTLPLHDVQRARAAASSTSACAPTTN